MTYDPSAFQGRAVLVTGATGFVGRHLCRALTDLGARVVGVARRWPAQTEEGLEGVEGRAVDLAHRSQVDELIDGLRPEVVFHLAGWVRGARDAHLVLPALEGNLLGTVHLLSALERAGCRRFVQAGSLEEPALGEGTAPSSPYAASKAAATTYCLLYRELYGLPVTLARIFMVYGPGPQDENKLVPYATRELLSGRAPRLSSGTRLVDWIYVDDVVEGLLRMALGAAALGRRVDLGTGALHSVAQVAETLAELAGGPPPELGARADRALEQERRADVRATRELLDWVPSTSLEEGLRATVDWFVSRGGSSS